jgi:hypothetical protein
MTHATTVCLARLPRETVQRSPATTRNDILSLQPAKPEKTEVKLF